MIVVDTSALVAIAFGEPERDDFVQVIQRAGKALICTVSALEARMVVHGRRGQRAVVLVDDFLRLPEFELVAPGVAETDAAYAAFVAFGKGSGHPAALNFGDVFSPNVAQTTDLRRLALCGIEITAFQNVKRSLPCPLSRRAAAGWTVVGKDGWSILD